MRLTRELLVVVQELDLANNDVITPLAIKAAADRWARQKKASIDSIWSGLRQQIYLGDDDFVERSQEQLRGDELTIPRTQRRGPAPPIEAVARKCAERNDAIVEA